jgi:hypothetical protein
MLLAFISKVSVSLVSVQHVINVLVSQPAVQNYFDKISVLT